MVGAAVGSLIIVSFTLVGVIAALFRHELKMRTDIEKIAASIRELRVQVDTLRLDLTKHTCQLVHKLLKPGDMDFDED